MKGMLYKAKGALALTLAMSLCGTQAFAAQALSAEEQGVKAAPVAPVEEKTKLTAEEALEKAKRNSPDLRAIQDTLEYLDDTMDDIDRTAGGTVTVPDVQYKKWVSDGWQKLVSAVYQTEQGQKQARIGEEMQNMGLEVSVKSYFASIKSNEQALALTKKNAEIQKRLYEQGMEKNHLGLLSKYKLDQLQIAAKQAQDRVALLEASMEQIYMKLNDLMGENADARFEYVYEVTFTPYHMGLSMDQYINAALKKDLTIQLKELAMDSAYFAKNYVGYSNTRADSNKQELDYDTAKRDYKTARTDKAVLIRNTYLQLQQMETQIASAQSDLTKAEADYRVAQINLQAGYVTKATVEQAEMGVMKAQNDLQSLVYNYDMLVYQFEHPSLLGNTATKQQKGMGTPESD
nr:TolC family protein [uncultured Anaerotignum sp.]